MRPDERVVRAAALLLPASRRSLRREEWLADLAGAESLGLSRRAVVGGALRAAVAEGVSARHAAMTPRRALSAAAIGLAVVMVGAPAAAYAAFLVVEARGVVTVETDADGSSREVLWRDYPGVPELEPDEILAGPTLEEGELAGRAMLAEIESELTAQLGLAWAPAVVDTDTEIPPAQNYYGGSSMLRILNIPSRQSTTVPTTWEHKQRVIAIIAEVGARYGFDDLGLDHDRPGTTPADAERSFGGATPESSVIVSGGLTGPTGQWVWFSLQDLSLDDDGRFAEQFEGSATYGWLPNSISLMYGANGLLPEGDRAEFQRRLEPFLGLARPEPLPS